MKNIFKTKAITFFFFSLFVCFISCKDDNKGTEEDPDKPYLEISDNSLRFIRFTSTQSITVDTNIEDITYEKSSKDNWYTVSYTNKTLTVVVEDNNSTGPRSGSVSIEGGKLKKTLTIVQESKSTTANDILEDIKIPVKTAEASSFQSGEGIEKSIDGDLNTYYHSNWNNSADDYFPITLTYDFENVTTMDYLVYHPRKEGSNGHFKEFEVWVATKSNTQLQQYGTYNFQGSSSANRISFTPALEEPVQIQFIVKSGSGDNQGFAACAEMEFYRKNPDNFDYMTIFSDITCSQLKTGITESGILKITSPFFKDLALDIFKGLHDTEFRIQEYKSWQHPDIMSAKNKTGTYSLRDNPTGIYATVGEDLIVFAEDLKGQNVSLFIQNPDNKISGVSFSLSAGMTKITPTLTGLVYIMYHTENGTEKPVKIHIASGNVNGYFDSQKHAEEDWTRLLDQAKFRHFDVVGKYAHLTYETESFRKYTKEKGMDLINKYDKLVYDEQEFMGLVKYDRMYKNRAYFLVVYEGYMYAGGYHMGYEEGTLAEMANPEIFSTTAIWGPAHELGHIHQTRPGLKWVGTTEVTNNIHSQYIQTSWGNKSRLMTEDLGGGQNRYQKAKIEIIDAKIPHNAAEDVFCKLVPFWQLKLYMHDVVGKTDFYADVYEAVRNNPNPGTNGECQLQFVKIVCDVAKLDLTDFFEVWGFLTPISKEIEDYSKEWHIITQEQIDILKAEIALKNYLKPKHSNIHEINDNNVSSYK